VVEKGTKHTKLKFIFPTDSYRNFVLFFLSFVTLWLKDLNFLDGLWKINNNETNKQD